CIFFFFSSRRRHTRFSRDWSSDVCSSDLKNYKKSMKQRGIEANADMLNKHFVQREEIQGGEIFTSIKEGTFEIAFLNREYYMIRSEERRVGKECRSRWSQDCEKIKK